MIHCDQCQPCTCEILFSIVRTEQLNPNQENKKLKERKERLFQVHQYFLNLQLTKWCPAAFIAVPASLSTMGMHARPWYSVNLFEATNTASSALCFVLPHRNCQKLERVKKEKGTALQPELCLVFFNYFGFLSVANI